MDSLALFYDAQHARHDNPGCVENKARVDAIYQEAMRSRDTLQNMKVHGQGLKDEQLLGREVLERVHGADYVSGMLSQVAELKGDEVRKVGSSYLCRESVSAAIRAASLGLLAIDTLMQQKAESAYVLTRPPGHHAGVKKTVDGFCIFNNVAVAARHLLDRYGKKRVLILDWDVHHGNGTQEIFYSSSEVLFVSIHKYNQAKFYPCHPSADYQSSGNGFNVNIPIDNYSDTIRISDHDYVYVYEKVIGPLIAQFQPDFVLISNGLDALAQDPLGKLHLTQDAFGYILFQVQTYLKAQGMHHHLALFLEGGYNIPQITKASLFLLSVLNDSARFAPHFCALKNSVVPSETIMKTVREVLTHLDRALPASDIDSITQTNLSETAYFRLASGNHKSLFFQDGCFFSPLRCSATVKLFEMARQNQDPFYQQHMAQYVGTVAKGGVQYLQMKDLLHGQSMEHLVLLDLKLDQILYQQQGRSVRLSVNRQGKNRLWRQLINISDLQEHLASLIQPAKNSQILQFYKKLKLFIRQSKSFLFNNISLLFIYNNQSECLSTHLIGLQNIEQVSNNGDKILQEMISRLIEQID